MAQVKVYGERAHLQAIRDALSDIIHAVHQEVLALPENKRFHRFIGLDAEDFLHPSDRSGAYTIIEILMFEGRSPESKALLLQKLMQTISGKLELAVEDVEIVIIETPRANWGIRGCTGDQLELSYDINR